ncbi:MAG: hypothetical protein ACYSTI_12310 [Planctomycetota bacterium]|jgi:hypothetical protein
MAKEKKWAQKVDVKENALKDIGWPSADAIWRSIQAGKVSYATAIRRLNFIANMGNVKARQIIKTLQKKRGKK